MSRSPSRSPLPSAGSVRYAATSVTSAPASRSCSASSSRAMSARGSRNRLPFRSPRAQRVDDGLGAILLRRQVDLDAVAREPAGGRRSDRADLHAAERADVARSREQPRHEVIDAVGAREHDPVIGRRVGRRAIECRHVVGRSDPDRGRLDRLGAEILEQLDELAACSRDRVTTMRRPKSGRSSNQRRCSRRPATAPTTSIAPASKRELAVLGDRRRACRRSSSGPASSRGRSARRLPPAIFRSRRAWRTMPASCRALA